MTAPIRSMADLVEALRSTQVERELSYEIIDAISGLQSGYSAKILGPKQSKRLGPVSTFPLLGALGKAIALVDDPQQIALVEGRWRKRKIVGGSARQLKLRAASLEHAKREGISIKKELSDAFARMQKLGQKGGKASGKVRLAKARKRREIRAKRVAAARLRWDKANSNPSFHELDR